MLSFFKKQTEKDLICSLQNGDPIVPATATKRFQEVTQVAGYKVTFQQLRHAYAGYSLKKGIHPKVVAERLGHSTISTTLDIYSHVAPTLQREAADSLEAILFKKGAQNKCYRNVTEINLRQKQKTSGNPGGLVIVGAAERT